MCYSLLFEDIQLVRDALDEHIPDFYRAMVDEVNPSKSLERFMGEYDRLQQEERI